jgi:LPS-assembly protein
LSSALAKKLLAAAACVLACTAASGQDSGLRLKLDKHLRPVPPRIDREAAKFLEADRIEGEQEKTVTASGDVVMRQRGATIRADHVDYDVTDQTAVATGHVRLEREGDIVMGPRLVYHLDTESGEIEQPVFEFPRKDQRRIATRGSAARAVLEPGNKSRLFNASYTSCPAPREDWILRVGELDVDSFRNVGNASNTTLYFLGVPIFYSPYLTFPLDNKRKTGFLTPTLGTSGKSGFEIALPFYWNIAENRDATFTPKWFTKRGLQLGAEFRYLEPTFAGQIDGEYLPNDRVAGIDRYFVGLRHVHQLPWAGWSASLVGQKVSDDDYFRDLSRRLPRHPRRTCRATPGSPTATTGGR